MECSTYVLAQPMALHNIPLFKCNYFSNVVSLICICCIQGTAEEQLLLMLHASLFK